MKKHLMSLGLGMALLASGSTASAALYDFPLADNAFITIGSLDWAWASPCSPVDPSCGVLDLSFQSAFGWHLPSIAEFALRPAASDFLFVGGNVPQGGVDPLSLSRWGTGGTDAPFDVGSAGACAAGYFGTFWRHCDYQDGVNGVVWDPGSTTNADLAETWVVRAAVPEPATLFLVAGGLGLIALRRRVR